jgi:tetratricopeptide (TPR) repeat protein
MKDKKIILGVVAGVILLILAGYYIYTDISSVQEDPESIIDGIGIKGEGAEDAVIEIIPTDTSISIPDLDSEVTYSSKLSDEVVLLMKDKIATTRSFLKKDSNLIDDWIGLGVLYKMVEDFDKAIEAWDYAGVISPTNSVSFQNLGDLYGYYLKDPVKGEENFLRAISNSPSDVYLYFKTADFYKDVMEDETKRRQIVEQGIETNPDVQELKDLLESL